MNDAIERISAYLSRRQKARGIDKENIHGFDVGPDCGVELLASDLHAVLDEVADLRQKCDELTARLVAVETQEPVGNLQSHPDYGHEFTPRIPGDWSMLGADLYIRPVQATTPE